MPERSAHAARALIDATIAVAQAGVPLMRRIVPDDADFRVWDHFPADDAVDRRSGARWFYHAHPIEERGDGEHGHFHLFLPVSAFAGETALAAPANPADNAPRLVHIAAVTIDLRGIPTQLFTVNRWVTDEWLFPAEAVIARLPKFRLAAATGDRLVNRWLVAAVKAYAPELAAILAERDRVLLAQGPTVFENRAQEVLSSIDIDLQDLVAD
jgi:hypothetical protein